MPRVKAARTLQEVTGLIVRRIITPPTRGKRKVAGAMIDRGPARDLRPKGLEVDVAARETRAERDRRGADVRWVERIANAERHSSIDWFPCRPAP